MTFDQAIDFLGAMHADWFMHTATSAQRQNAVYGAWFANNLQAGDAYAALMQAMGINFN